MQLIITKMDSGVQSSRDKIDVSTRKFDDQVTRLSKDIVVRVFYVRPPNFEGKLLVFKEGDQVTVVAQNVLFLKVYSLCLDMD